MRGNLTWIFVLIASVVIMLVVNTVVIFRSRRGGRGYRPGQDRRPGAPKDADGRPDRGQGGAPRRNDGGAGGQRKHGDGNRNDGNRGGGQRQGGQQGGRPQQDRGGKPGSSSIDPMEMSLRDINQRLKNAEREQDSARKNLRDGDGSDGEGRGRDGRQQRGGRDGRDGRDGGRGGNRDDRGPRRDSNRDNRGGGRPERQERGDGAGRQQDHNRFRQNEQAAEAQERPQAPDIVGNDLGVPEDQLQHGRRFTAKRRMLPDGPGSPEESSQQDRSAPVPESVSAPTGDSGSSGWNERQEQGGAAEDIQFGR
jgi:hypothetical protein